MKLLDFQLNAKQAIHNALLTTKCVLLQSATASGKTVIASDLIKDYVNENKKILFLVNLQVLVGQTYETLKEFRIEASVLHDEITETKSGIPLKFNSTSNVMITLPETFHNTWHDENILSKSSDWTNFKNNWKPDLIVIDEAHKATSSLFQFIRDLFEDAKIVGLTATPYRAKNDPGEHLTEWYGNNLITTISVEELIKIGRLVQPIYKKYNYDKDSLVNVWLDVTSGHKNKSTIIFTQDTQHSLKIEEAFTSRGITAKIVTAGSDSGDEIVAKQSTKLRNEIYKNFEDGKIEVLISVVALCEGFDSPNAHFCFLARTVGNIALFHQMIGRVLRSHPTKQNGYVCDFFDNLVTHGHIEDFVWSLIDTRFDIINVTDRKEISHTEFKTNRKLYHVCNHCSLVYDLKKHHNCTSCKTPHDKKIFSFVNELLKEKMGIEDKKQFDEMLSRFRPAMKKDDMSKIAQKNINKRFGLIFDNDGNLTKDYLFIEHIAPLNKNDWTSKLDLTKLIYQ